jgi:hypothetical protein
MNTYAERGQRRGVRAVRAWTGATSFAGFSLRGFLTPFPPSSFSTDMYGKGRCAGSALRFGRRLAGRGAWPRPPLGCGRRATDGDPAPGNARARRPRRVAALIHRLATARPGAERRVRGLPQRLRQRKTPAGEEQRQASNSGPAGRSRNGFEKGDTRGRGLLWVSDWHLTDYSRAR